MPAPSPGTPRIVGNYSFSAVTCIIDSLNLNHYSQDGGIDVSYDGSLVEAKKSADGITTYVDQNNDDMTITITLVETSGAVPILEQLALAQVDARRAGFVVPLYPFFMQDPQTGDTIIGDAVFVDIPTPTKMRDLSDREFVIHLSNSRFRGRLGANNQQTI